MAPIESARPDLYSFVVNMHVYKFNAVFDKQLWHFLMFCTELSRPSGLGNLEA